MRTQLGPSRQRGVAAVIVGLALVVLIGFAGLVVDLGRLFVTKSELQSAVDSCALAAARYINAPTAQQLRVATNAGVFAGNKHRAVLQDNQIALTAGDVTFSDELDGNYRPAGSFTDDSEAGGMGYVRCQYRRDSIVNSFMQLFGFDLASVVAAAKASLVPSNITCLMPVAMCCENAVGGCPSTTFNVGQWYEGRIEPNPGPGQDPVQGSFRWVRLPDDSGSNDIVRRIESSGACDLVDANEGVTSEPGFAQAIIAAFNTRFGLYAPSYSSPAADPVPDKTSLAYTEAAPETQTAGSPPFPGRGTATTPRAYLHYRDTAFPSYTPYGPGANLINTGNARSGLDIPNNYTALTENQLRALNNGLSRRLVTLPVVKCGPGGLATAVGQNPTPILAWACMFMIHPVSTGTADPTGLNLRNMMRLEYVDAANSVDSACGSGGRPSGPGGNGPRVPGLVQ